MAQKDAYEILGVSKTASQEEIKTAFRNKAKQYHPDIYKGDKAEGEEKFKEIGGAYKILSDPEARKRYDAYGYDGLKGGPGGGSGFGGFDSMFDMGDLFSDIFGDIFGFESSRSRGGSRRVHGDDIRHDIAIDFEQAGFEEKHKVEINRKEICDTCKGEGIKPGTKKATCTTCGGKGKVRQAQGFFSMVTTCPHCHGEGSVAEHLCEDCSGRKVKMKKRKIEVNIPAGVTQGSYLKLSGEGHTGLNGGASGDLFVVINIREHEIYRREGDDIILELPVTITQSVLGDEVEVPTIYGNQKIKIPAGIQSGDILNLKGKGFTHLNSFGKGDMHVVVHVETPKHLNSKLKEAFKNVKLVEKEDNYTEVKKIRKKMGKYIKRGEK